MNEISAFLAGSVLMVLTLNLLRRFIRWIDQSRGPYVIEKGDLVRIDSKGFVRKVMPLELPIGTADETSRWIRDPLDKSKLLQVIKLKVASDEENL